jgi:hypothetical protein
VVGAGQVGHDIEMGQCFGGFGHVVENQEKEKKTGGLQ